MELTNNVIMINFAHTQRKLIEIIFPKQMTLMHIKVNVKE
jgi:hypothetical protein